MSEKRYRVAIIGTGMIANFAHLPACSLLGKSVEVVGCADIREAAARETAANFKIPKVYTDPQKMLDELRPDIAVVAAPNMHHKNLSLMALRSGAHVVCEKPVALKYADAVELFAEARKLRMHFFPAQTYRFFNEQAAVKTIVNQGVLGDVYYAEFDAVRRRGIPRWGFFHIKQENGGGPFCDLGVHQLDYLLWLLGNPDILSVSGATWTKHANTDENIAIALESSGAYGGMTFTPRPYDWREFDVEDMAAGSMRLQGGTLINFKTSWAVNLPENYARKLAGTRGGLEAGEGRPVTIYGTDYNMLTDTQPEIVDQSGVPKSMPFPGHVALWRNVLGVLNGTEEPVVKAEETLNVTAGIEAFYLSAQSGREVLCSEIKGL